MPRRDDDDLDFVAGLSADRDDARYRPKAADPRAAGSNAASAVIRTSKNSSRGWVFSVVVLLLLLICAGLGYQVWTVERQLSQSEAEISSAVKRIDQLSHEVFATGSTMTESESVVEKKFKFFDSEIRKLWDVSNKRNKASIKKNADQVKSLASQINKASGQVKSSDSKVAAMEKQQTELNAKIKQVNRQLQAENTTLRATLEDHKEQFLLIRRELEKTQNRLQAMAMPNDLELRVASNEEAIEAIDAARRQLVSNITQLQSRLNQLQTPK